MKTKHYTTLLFDADNTLLDFSKTEAHALNQTFRHFGMHLSPEIKELYQDINHSLWQDFEAGLIDKETVVQTRFHLLFKELDIDLCSRDFEDYYQPALSRSTYLVKGASEICAELSQYFDLYIVTNGVSSTQHSRLAATGLDRYMKDIFVSEDLKSQKPQKKYFDKVFELIPGFSRDTAMIIGDSLTSDIAGGIAAGIDTCWFNPQHCTGSRHIHPTYQISELDDLHDLLLEVS